MIDRYTRPEMAKIWTDESRFGKMLDVELYACEAFVELGVMPKSALENVKKNASFNVQRIREIEEKTNHDVVAFIKNISENIGEDAKYLHFGLTSSDILDTALSAQMCEAMDILLKDMEELKHALREKALKYKKTPMMGRSHGVHAEPTSFGLKMALFYREIERDIERMKHARKDIAVAKVSGAVGTFANVEPFVEEYVAKKMGLEPARVASQVIQRDRHAYYLSVLAITGATLEKLAIEIRGLQRTEIGEAQEYFAAGQAGSSAMPHKQNPIISERITGLARLLRTNALAAIENVALWHERDISHSSVERVILPDSTIVLDYMLGKAVKLVEKLVVNEKRMLENIGITKGLIFSQHLLLELIKKGVTRVEAYDIVQQLSLKAIAEGEEFSAVVEASGQVKKYLKTEEIKNVFDLAYHLKKVDEVFSKIGLK